MRMPVFAIVATLALTAAQAPAPPAPQPQVTFRTGIDIVQLDVSVVDRNQQPVRGLTAADFTVVEGGARQEIVAFKAVDVPPPVAAPASWMRDVAPDVTANDVEVLRLVVIVMDDAGTQFDPKTSETAKRIAYDAIDRLGPADRAAVVYTYLGRNQNFTSDRARLRAAVDTFVPHPDSASCKSRQGGCQVDTLRIVGAALRTTAPSRKTLIYVGSNPGLRVSTDPAAQLTPVGEMFRALQEASVTVNAFDAAGLQVFGPSAADRTLADANTRVASAREGNDDLYSLAGNTGGRTFTNTNAPWLHVPEVFRADASYYLIGFRSTNTKADGRFHKVKVSVGRSDLEVRTRTGYFAARAEKKGARGPVVTALDKALMDNIPAEGVPLRATVAWFATPGKKDGFAIVTSGVTASSPHTRTQNVDIVAAAFDTEGKSLGRFKQNIDLVPNPAVPPTLPFEAVSRLPLRPGRYEIRVAAESQGRVGSTYLYLDIPDVTKEKLSLSGLVLARPRSAKASLDAVADLLPVVPTTVRRFAPGEHATAFVRVYQGDDSPSAVRVTTRILDELGGIAFEQTQQVAGTEFGTQQAADIAVALPLELLAEGDYLLRIEAALGDRHLERDARFSVRK